MATAQVVAPTPIHQPDIAYAPDYDKYLARVQRRLATERLNNSLPEGFPLRLESDLVWDKHDIGNRYNWTHQLTPDELDEIDTALQYFKSLSKPLGFASSYLEHL